MGYAELTSIYENSIGDVPWNIYPRPQMKRESFIPLNGKWDFYIPGKRRGTLDKYKITVPFPPQSKISGVFKNISQSSPLIYYKKIELTIPENMRTILHFGAVDQICRVYVNNYLCTTHCGGYLPFEIDITKYVISGENEISLEVTDATDNKYPHGKQRVRRGGMWYTPISGIWQTVWIEYVPDEYIKTIKILTSGDEVTFIVNGGEPHKEVFITTEWGCSHFHFESDRYTIRLPSARFWSPEDPYLYNYSLLCGDDKISGYFALRDITLQEGKILLNGKPIFLHALLDQGYYSDGIYLPACCEEYENDIKLAKRMGFNALRKHLKVEPLYFYYLCDKLGMLVMQDFVQNGRYSFFYDSLLPTLGLKKLPKRNRNCETINNFVSGAKETAELLASTPSVIYYTVFNEGWGQFSEKECDIYEEIKKINSNKIIDTASGWFRPDKTDVISDHIYFGSFSSIAYSEHKASILSEYGGFSLKINGHTFGNKKYGYKSASTPQELYELICSCCKNKLIPEIQKGLSGAVMTQLSDVEDELNGLITYDRVALKVCEENMKELSDMLFEAFNSTLSGQINNDTQYKK